LSVDSHSFVLSTVPSPLGGETIWFISVKNDMFPQPLSDETLAARIAQGDTAAFETLYDHYAGSVLGICLKIVGDRALAERLLQETFWRVWQNASSYHPERGSFAGWLFRLARNLAIDTRHRPAVSPKGAAEIVESDSEANVVDRAQSNRETQKARSAFAKLSHEQRQVIEMAYFYGMTRQEIADATGETLDRIATLARLGLKKLRGKLEKGNTQ
jgi:RNA polymerase sigma-70 factor (ECF subfamily)